MYPDLHTAEHAITKLEEHGFDGDDVHLFGDAVERADRSDVAGRDEEVTKRVLGGAVVGTVVGAVVGALLGLVVGALIGGDLWWVYALIGAVGLGAFGLAVGGYSRVRASDQWELTLEHVPGEAAVAVRTNDGRKLDEAADTLRDAGAVRVELH